MWNLRVVFAGRRSVVLSCGRLVHAVRVCNRWTFDYKKEMYLGALVAQSIVGEVQLRQHQPGAGLARLQHASEVREALVSGADQVAAEVEHLHRFHYFFN